METSNSLIEIGNPITVNKLCCMTYTTFIDLIKQTEWSKEVEDEVYETNYKQQFNIIKEYCKKLKNNNYGILTHYKAKPKQPRGRVYGKNSIQPIWSLFKGIIAYDKYYDFDMKCAHQSILLSLCKENNIDCYNLGMYVNYRDDWLLDFCETEQVDRVVSKNMFIRSLNTDYIIKKCEKKNITNLKFKAFDEEIKKIQKLMVKKYPSVWTKIKQDNRETENRYGKFISYICCIEENRLLQKVAKIVKPSVLMFDGMLIDKKNIENVNEFVEKLNETTINWVKWDVKEMDYSLYELIMDMEFSQENVSIVASNMSDLSKELIETFFKDRLYKNNSGFFYKMENKWIKGSKASLTDSVFCEIMRVIGNMDLWVLDEDTGANKQIKDGILDKRLAELIYVNTPLDKLFINRIWEHQLHKLYFNNGCYDFETETFGESDGNTFNVIEYDIKFERDNGVREQIYKRIFNPIFTCYKERGDYEERCELRDYFIYMLARGAGGAVSDKVWGTMVGERDCGKSLMVDFLGACFQEYSGTTNGKQLVYRESNTDPAKELSWLVGFEFKRFMLMSEMPTKGSQKSPVFYDGAKIKSVVSGGDRLEVRINYGNEYCMRFGGLLLAVMNDEADSKPTDAMKNNKCFNCITKFIDEGAETKKKYITYLPKDDTVKFDFIKRQEVINEFMLMLFESYNNKKTYPKSLQAEREENATNDDDDILDLFKFTKNASDFIGNKQLRFILKENGHHYTLMKLRTNLKSMGAKEKNMGASGRGLTGIIYCP